MTQPETLEYTVDIENQSHEAQEVDVRHAEKSLGVTATRTEVQAVAHDCAGGAAVCGHRGFDLVGPDGSVVERVDFAGGEVDTKDQ